MRLAFLTAAVCLTSSAMAAVPFVNWENHPVRPLAMSPDGRTLAVTHTADARVQLFDVSEGRAVALGHVPVGVDPVAVQFRTATEAWVVNHISDSISVVDIESRMVLATLQTADEPFDIVFAGTPERAYVSCSQANVIHVFDPANLTAEPVEIPIAAEDPRALAVSPDGQTVYAAIFESGNRTTLLGGGAEDLQTISFPPNVTTFVTGPYGGQNPPPNNGATFLPALNPALPTPPRVGLIVRQDAQGRWKDDNNTDWTAFVSGPQAAQSGRVPGWSMPDRDIAIIETGDDSVSYISGLMNIGMALTVNPDDGRLGLVGTEAINEVRFEPVINGTFVRVNIAVVEADESVTIRDLNSHLDYASPAVDQATRDLSLGDPRGIAWRADGQRGYVVGMGSNNLVVINRSGKRLDSFAPVELGEGPIGIVIDDEHDVGYVWNHFEASLSTVDLVALEEVDRQAAFNPLPEAITAGRPFLYDTHRTSGLGHLSCASCHVDSRMDRLAWDLGDPSGEMKAFNQNCTTAAVDTACQDFHPMKGPMVTQTLQDIIGNEPFHWRGDRDGLEEFNGAFTGLLGDDVQLTSSEMQAYEDFLATITFPPNPYRNFDNSLPTSVDLAGHVTTGRHGPANQPLGTGDAVQGLALYTDGLSDDPFHCVNCHTLPTGMGRNGTLVIGDGPLIAGGTTRPVGPNGENHLGIVGIDGSTNRSIKVAQLRNLYDKVGMDAKLPESSAGFGFLHDGSVDSLARFVSLEAFPNMDSDQDVADMVALMLAFSGSDFEGETPPLFAPDSLDTPAAVGAQETVTSSDATSLQNQMLALADAGQVDVVVHEAGRGWVYDDGTFVPDDGSGARSKNQLRALASADNPLTFSVVPEGLGERLGVDRDGDAVFNGIELSQGSRPGDASSSTFTPTQGLWAHALRDADGFDLQILDGLIVITWFTYNDDGTGTWYQAFAPIDEVWTAELARFSYSPGGEVVRTVVGSATLTFSDARHAEFAWTIDGRSASAPFELLLGGEGRTLRNYTGTWAPTDEPGWGVTFYSVANLRVAVMYFYDENSAPRWAWGVGANDASALISMLSFTGPCPDCPVVAATTEAAGELNVDFASERTGALTSTVFYPGLPDSGWAREDVSMIPLSDPWRDPAAD